MASGKYNEGFQPCDDFELFDPYDVHACMHGCESGTTVGFCRNCLRDHHEYGWQTCVGHKDCEKCKAWRSDHEAEIAS